MDVATVGRIHVAPVGRLGHKAHLWTHCTPHHTELGENLCAVFDGNQPGFFGARTIIICHRKYLCAFIVHVGKSPIKHLSKKDIKGGKSITFMAHTYMKWGPHDKSDKG